LGLNGKRSDPRHTCPEYEGMAFVACGACPSQPLPADAGMPCVPVVVCNCGALVIVVVVEKPYARPPIECLCQNASRSLAAPRIVG